MATACRPRVSALAVALLAPLILVSALALGPGGFLGGPGGLLGGPAPAYATTQDILNNPQLQLFFPGRELADLTGYNGKRVYLLVWQNQFEIRPTGGFIGYFALVELDHGRVTMKKFIQVYPFDWVYRDYLATHPGEKDPVPPPYTYLGVDSLYLRDRNWAPDFPTAGKSLATIYNKEAVVFNNPTYNHPPDHPGGTMPNTTVNGVIGVVQEAGGSMINAFSDKKLVVTSPTAAYSPVTFTPETFGLDLQVIENTRPSVRGVLFHDLMSAMMSRVNSASSAEQDAIVMAMIRAFSQKQMLMYSSNTANQAALVKLGWAGALTPSPRDYIAMNDANIGGSPHGNKNFEYVPRSLDYSPRLMTNMNLASDLLVTWRNLGVPGYFHGLYGTHAYDSLEDAYYFAYTRALLPSGAVLNTYTNPLGYHTVDRSSLEWGRRVLGDYVGWSPAAGLDPDETMTARYGYTVPGAVVRYGGRYQYDLDVQKQPGSFTDAGNGANRFRFNWGSDWTYVTGANFTPDVMALSGPGAHRVLTYATDLLYDRHLQVELAADHGVLPYVLDSGSWSARAASYNISGSAKHVTLDVLRTSGSRYRKTDRTVAGHATFVGRLSSAVGGSVSGSMDAKADGSVAASVLMKSRYAGAAGLATSPRLDADTTIIWPYVRGLGSWESYLGLRNVALRTANVTLKLYDTGGNQLRTVALTIPARGRWQTPTDSSAYGIIGGFTGSAVATCDQPLVGYVRFSESGKDRSALAAATPGRVADDTHGAGEYELDFPYVVDTTSRTSYLEIRNGATSAAAMTLYFYDRRGRLVHTEAVSSVPARSVLQVRPQWMVHNSFAGSVFVVSNQPVAGLMWNQNSTTTQLGAVAAGRAGTKLVMPGVADDGRYWKATVVVMNTSDDTTTVTMSFYRRDGRRVLVRHPVLAPGAYYSVSPRAALHKGFDGSAVLSAGQPIAGLWSETAVSSSRYYALLEAQPR